MKTFMYGFCAMMVVLALQVFVDVAQAGVYGSRSYFRPSYSRPSYFSPSRASRPSYTSVKPATPAARPPVVPAKPLQKPLQQKKPEVSKSTTTAVRHASTPVREQSSWTSWMPLWMIAIWGGGSGNDVCKAKGLVFKDGKCEKVK